MSTEFNAQLERLLEREKIARVNNEHFNSVAILKDIVLSFSFRLHYAIRLKTGKSSTK